jgi:mono/diheme cytochrome c family protein
MSKRNVIFVATGLGLVLIIFLTACGKEPRGAILFKTHRCIECHDIKGKGGSAGPNLTYVGQRRSRDYIIEQIKNPASHNPNTAMPSFSSLPEADINELADYLSKLK